MTDTRDILDQLRTYDPDVDGVYVIDGAIAEIERLRRLVDPDEGVWHMKEW